MKKLVEKVNQFPSKLKLFVLFENILLLNKEHKKLDMALWVNTYISWVHFVRQIMHIDVVMVDLSIFKWINLHSQEELVFTHIRNNDF